MAIGGVTNGFDLLIGYARAGKYWHPALVDIGLKLTEVVDRGQFYDQNAASYMSALFWHVVRFGFVRLWDTPTKHQDVHGAVGAQR